MVVVWDCEVLLSRGDKTAKDKGGSNVINTSGSVLDKPGFRNRKDV